MSHKLILLVLAAVAHAHGDHTFDLDDAEDAKMPYAERHMHTEHHIDSFDLESFFKLHDLDMDGVWDVAEIQAVYGLHHHSVKEKIPQQQVMDSRTRAVVDKVLQRQDRDNDGKISLQEFLDGGADGLPSFEGYRDLGHHYDEESEYFLHHEELYHSTPETQTDEAYNHPEDIEHFRHHHEIEEEEDARERKFQGLAEDADLSKDHVAQDPLEDHAHAPGEGPDGKGSPAPSLKAGDPVPPPPRLHREDPGATPHRLQAIDADADKEDWRQAKANARGKEYDYARPRSAEERARANVPYKYNADVQVPKGAASGRVLGECRVRAGTMYP
ncbi:hypothetical protein DB88DRAFT_29411 [Papiliotrema laurentii]|uniref:EF-hand domain-containing protein n=1 Tax=Papiliotrema laurentii TaxID=5418 RepID=A0AAD9FWA3_PAPLA|nr:hypothetical protein DB88DRAFT_29411 [Papiliotrema laurentii]